LSQSILILGMHRSGTSALAGTLQAAGLEMGDVISESPSNAKGSRELRPVMRLNEGVLRDNGGAWFDPPVGVLRWSNSRLEVLAKIVAGLPLGRPRGIKDPRFLFTGDPWVRELGNVVYVASIRNPAAVVDSLDMRHPGKFTREYLYSLWMLYNQRLLNFASQERVLIVSYDCSAQYYQRQIEWLLPNIGLASKKISGNVFFDDRLRHHARPVADVPIEASSLFEALNRQSIISRV